MDVFQYFRGVLSSKKLHYSFNTLGSVPVFKAEGMVWKVLLHSEENVQKAFSVDWPLYDLLNRTVSISSKQNVVYYFNSMIGVAGLYYVSVIQYYLYPRKVVVVNPGDEVKMSDILNSDYILFYMPHGFTTTGVESAISGIPEARLIYKSDAGAYQVIYSIKKKGIR